MVVAASERAVGATITRIETLTELSQIEHAWRRLQCEDPDATAFSTWEWCSVAARHFVRDGDLRCLLVERDGEPVGLAPLALGRHIGLRTLMLVGSGMSAYSMADYGDVLSVPGANEAVLDAVLNHLDVERGWDDLWLQDLRTDSMTARLLPMLARRRGWRVLVEAASASYSISLPESVAAYQATLSANNRKALRRRTNKLREHGGAFETLAPDKDPTAALETLIELHTRRWQQDGKPGIFARPAVRDFHRDIVRELHASGLLDLTVLRAGGEAVAAQYAIDFNGRRHFYINGYDPAERWQPLSLGSLLDMNRIEAAITAGLDTADFGRGEGDYKQRYSPATHAKLHVHVCRTEAAYRRLQAYGLLRRFAKRLLGRKEPS